MAEATLESVQGKIEALDTFVGTSVTTTGPVETPKEYVAVRDALREILAYLRQHADD